MKTQKKLNLVLIVLIILLLAIVSFGGIYVKNKNDMKNLLPSYVLGNDLKGYRQISLVLDNSKETSENNEVTETNTVEETATEAKSGADYKKSAEIIKKRLKSLDVDNYIVSCDENTGKILVSLPEDDKTDVILSDIVEKGKFSINNNATGEELLNNSDVKRVDVGIDTSTGSKVLKLNIIFNTKGASKFTKITKNYQNQVDENVVENETTENSSEEATEETSENTTEESTEKSDKSDKKVTLKIDSSELLTTDFSYIIDNGVLGLTLGDADSIDQTKLESAMSLAAIIENDPLTVDYKIEENTYVASIVDKDTLKGIICIEIVLALVVALVIVAKYRMNGILSAIVSVGYIALLLITIRFANVTLSLNGILAILFAYLLNTCFVVLACENKKENLTKKDKNRVFKKLINKYTIIVIPQLLIALVCCFTAWAPIFSFGMVMFWGIIISWCYNAIMSKILL